MSPIKESSIEVIIPHYTIPPPNAAPQSNGDWGLEWPFAKWEHKARKIRATTPSKKTLPTGTRGLNCRWAEGKNAACATAAQWQVMALLHYSCMTLLLLFCTLVIFQTILETDIVEFVWLFCDQKIVTKTFSSLILFQFKEEENKNLSAAFYLKKRLWLLSIFIYYYQY